MHMVSGDAQTNQPTTDRHRKCKAILGPAGCALRLWPAGKNMIVFMKDTTTVQH